MKKINKIIVIDGKDYALNIFVERRNSVRCSLVNSGINIRLPKHLSISEQNKEGKRLLEWAVKKIKEGAKKIYEKRQYKTGDLIRVFDKEYVIFVESRLSTKNFTKISDGKIYFKIANHHTEEKKQEYLSKQLKKILAKEHLDDLIYHVNRINEKHFGEKIRKISFKYTTSRWGQCHTGRREIDISTRLLFAPFPVLEYVIIHELSHLKHANHSKRFWNLVKSIDPYYKAKEQWLKINGDNLKI